MKIGIDARTLSTAGGSNIYATHLIEELNKLNEPLEFQLFGNRSQKFENLPNVDPRPRSSPSRFIWENFSILPYMDELDIFHGIKNVVPPSSECKTIATVHDSFKYMDRLVGQVYWGVFAKRYMQRSDHLITPSAYTKSEIVEEFDVDCGSITVIPHGYNSDLFFNIDREKAISELQEIYPDKKNIFNNFILNVGFLRKNKNQENLIKSLPKLGRQDIDVILVGKDNGYKEGLIEMAKQKDLLSNVHFLGYIPKDHLSLFYNAACLFCYPSYYDGFGLPPLEAMACGTPVVASDAASIPEVVDSAGILVDPGDIDNIATEMDRVLSDDSLHHALSEKGMNRAAEFSWKRTAKQTASVYKQVLKDE